MVRKKGPIIPESSQESKSKDDEMEPASPGIPSVSDLLNWEDAT
eukprot:CAMPEP_0167772040 /NCGR_PEP_ID=MMETSP0111_2-20121227/622_1 /TAXON_ID=91324 /ORGANISM="Lotharella globosa, Strain CCCM811" /LENGTH=43 /DNA_ID= /DNA_START= /DNA_END= /DNA_ORIENTATION=